MKVLVFLFAVLLCGASAKVVLVSGLQAVVSSGQLTISTYPYNVNFPVAGASWIWNQNWNNSPTGEVLTFIHHFKLNCVCDTFILYATADNSFKAYINGKLVLSGDNWGNVYSTEIHAGLLNNGQNSLVVVAANAAASPAALIYGIKTL